MSSTLWNQELEALFEESSMWKEDVNVYDDSYDDNDDLELGDIVFNDMELLFNDNVLEEAEGESELIFMEVLAINDTDILQALDEIKKYKIMDEKTVIHLKSKGMEVNNAIKVVGQSLVVLAVISFILQWLIPRVHKLWKVYGHSEQFHDNIVEGSGNDGKTEKIRQQQQKYHSEKAASFNERILLPREKERLKQKEEEYRRFMGPAWKGEGMKLGGSEGDLNDLETDNVSPSSSAARRRHLPEPEVKTPADIKPKPEPKPKKIIILPDEPSEGADDAVTVRLRTLIGSFCQRRFLQTHTVQDLLDYMTTCGYSQTFYTLSTTYPRSLLTGHVTSTLHDLQFIKKVTLNIEEKE